MILEILKFATSDFWTFLGCFILISTVSSALGYGLANLRLITVISRG